jgi:hypothetical protein
MFFFFPFAGVQPAAARSSGPAPLPFLPKPKSASSSSSRAQPDFWGYSVDLLRGSISTFAQSLTAISSRANALFTQVAAALAFDRIARDSMAFFQAAMAGFGAPSARQSAFGFSWPSRQQDSMSFSPTLQGFTNPGAGNPWAAFSQGLDFWAQLLTPAPQKSASYKPAQPEPNIWNAVTDGLDAWTKMWTPAEKQRNSHAANWGKPASSSPFTAKVSAPGGFTLAFSWGA